jgi:hypothetical protein
MPSLRDWLTVLWARNATPGAAAGRTLYCMAGARAEIDGAGGRTATA